MTTPTHDDPAALAGDLHEARAAWAQLAIVAGGCTVCVITPGFGDAVAGLPADALAGLMSCRVAVIAAAHALEDAIRPHGLPVVHAGWHHRIHFDLGGLVVSRLLPGEEEMIP